MGLRQNHSRPATPGAAASGTPRICMPTARNFTRRAFQCAFYEAQDILREVENVDLLRLEPGWGFGFREGWHRRLLYHDVSKRLIFMNPGLKSVRLFI